MPTEAQYKEMICLKVGEHPGGRTLIRDNINVLWSMQAEKAGDDRERQYYLCLLEALDIVIGAIWDGSYHAVGFLQKKALDSKIDHLTKMKTETKALLDGKMQILRYNLDIYEPEPGS